MKEKIKAYSIISVGILSSVVLLKGFIEYLLPVLSPFIISLIIATVTVKPARRLSKRIKASPRIIRLVISIAATLFFFSAVIFLLWQISTALWHFLTDIGEENRLYDILSTILSLDVPIFGELFPPGLAEKISSAVGELISDCLSLLAEWITGFATALPRVFLFIVVTLISLVYFSLDYDKIARFVSCVFPEKAVKTAKKMRDGVLFVIKKYITSYSVILLITYTVIFIGLCILRINHSALIALFIALLDILPIIGVGAILIPWSIFSFILGNNSLGIGLIILFVVNSIIRQLSEPKIVGKNLDLHPIITLLMIYVGYRLFGFWGVIILPVASVSIGTVLKQNEASDVG